MAKYDPIVDRLICIGDYVDYGNSSFEIVEHLLSLYKISNQRNIFLLGNHDQYFYKALQEEISKFRDWRYIEQYHWEWYIQGGKETYDSYIKRTDEEIIRHRDQFFAKLKLFYIENNTLFVHAGYDTKLGLQQTIEQLGHEELLWNRELYRKALEQYQLNQSEGRNDIFDGFKRIFVGHTPTIADKIYEPIMIGKLVNVDQGCKLDGRLTAWVLETDEYFQYVDF